MTRLKTSGLPAAFCWVTALSRWNLRPEPSALPVIALIRSIQTAVGCWETVAILDFSVESLWRPAAAVTEADQDGLMYWTAPLYGLSTWLSALALVAVISGAATSAAAVAA